MMQKFKVLNTQVIKFAIVETNFGIFRVATNGNVTKYNENLQDFDQFDADDFEAWELAQVEQAGLEEIVR